jgi:hypothetical protein
MPYTATVTVQTSISNDPAYQPESVRVLMNIIAVQSFNDPGLFMFFKDPVTQILSFSHVASPTDLATYPYNVLAPNVYYVRKSSLDITYNYVDDANSAITTIQDGIKSLCLSMNTLQTLQPPTTTTIV